MKRLVLFVMLAVLCVAPARPVAQGPSPSVAVSVAGDHFQVEYDNSGVPQAKFLAFISYFDGGRASASVRDEDLDYIRDQGFDGIRVMATWYRRDANFAVVTPNEPFLVNMSGTVLGDDGTPNGAPNSPLRKLIDLVEAARSRRLVVNVTFFYISQLGVTNYINAVTRTATLLRPYKNVIIDLGNEFEINGPSPTDLQALRMSIQQNPDPAKGDPARILVASYSDVEVSEGAQVRTVNQSIGTSALAVHDQRATGWESAATSLVPALRAAGVPRKPVYYSEPTPWDSNLPISGEAPADLSDAQRFRMAIANARAAGAAAWTFHTRQAFKLDATAYDGRTSLRDRIDLDQPNVDNSIERAMLEGNTTPLASFQEKLTDLGHSGTWGIDAFQVSVTLNGNGTVTSLPSGISCGGDCSEIFSGGTANVKLTAQPAAGQQFLGWTGGGCSGTGDCHVTAAAAITAQFGPLPPTVQVTIQAPAPSSTVNGLVVSGWAIDQRHASASGIGLVKVYATQMLAPHTEYLVTTSSFTARPTVAATYGAQFLQSGFDVPVCVPPGTYVVYVEAYSSIDNAHQHASSAPVTVQRPAESDLRRAGDFDCDLKSEMTVFNPATGVWTSRLSSGNFDITSTTSWGGAGYLPAPGDYDGDGRTDFGLYSATNGEWLVLLSGSNYTTSLARFAGGPGWMPVAADFDGDHKTDPIVYNQATGAWYGLTSGSNFTAAFGTTFGGPTWTPAPGDYDGDGRLDFAVYRPNALPRWSVILSSGNYGTSLSQDAGGPGWIPVAADYDGDGKAELAVYNTTTGLWYGLKSSTNYTTAVSETSGGSGYTPIRGDYDGDGKADLAVYLGNGTWSIKLSGSAYTTTLTRNLGGMGVVAVPKFIQ